jgi:acyl-CoA thioester hydrolase
MTEYADAKPLYVHRSTVWFDELDMVGVLHNARYAIHVERAMSAWYHSLTDKDPSDAVVVVRQYNIEFLHPFTQQPGELVIECGLGKLGTTSAVFTFRALSYLPDGTEVEHARGIRAIVKVDPQTLRPAPWSGRYRELVG